MAYADFGQRWQHMISDVEDGLKKGSSPEEIMALLKEPNILLGNKQPDGNDWLRVSVWLNNWKKETDVLIGWLRREMSAQEQKISTVEELLPLVEPHVEIEPIHMY